MIVRGLVKVNKKRVRDPIAVTSDKRGNPRIQESDYIRTKMKFSDRFVALFKDERLIGSGYPDDGR